MAKEKFIQQNLSDVFGFKCKKVEEVEVKDKISLFTYLDDICYRKTGKVPLNGDYEMKKFDSFMILRFLSLESNYLPLINIFNQFQDVLTKKELYLSLIKIIPKSKKFLKYPKLEKLIYKEELLQLLGKYFECSKRDIKEYLDKDFLTDGEIDKIKIKIGGKVK